MEVSSLSPALILAGCLSLAGSVTLSYDPRSDCGRREIQCPVISTRIVGGDIWCAERMPYNVLIEFVVKDPRGGRIKGVKVHGGGTIISERHILTAAHVLYGNTVQTTTGTRICPSDFRKKTAEECLDDPCPVGCLRIHPSQLNVYAGVTNRTSLTRPIKVKKIFVHHGWNGNAPDNDIGKGHDIAILELETSFHFSPRVWPICLPDEADRFLKEEDRSVFAGGFGRNTVGKIPDLLQRAEMKITDMAECRRLWQDPRGGDRVTGSQICALGDRRNDGGLRADTCQGDSGGALTTVLGDRPFQIGITSFGDPNCGASINPGVYTNVIDHMDWINSVIRTTGCKTIETPPRKCVFPFKFDGRKFFSCTSYSDPNGEAWCSVKVDSEGNHIVGVGGWGFCQSSCLGGNNGGSTSQIQDGINGGSASQITDSSWTSWSQCSTTCKAGNRRRTRPSCPASETSNCARAQNQPCNQSKQCPSSARPVDCLKEWGSWSSCSASCGQGTKERSTRVVRKASNGGRSCSQQTKKQSITCSQQDCPSEDVLGSWGSWSSCTASCGDGSRSRQRSCKTSGGSSCSSTTACRGSSCSTSTTETQSCRVNCITEKPVRRNVIRLDQPVAPGQSKCRCSCQDHFRKIEDGVNNHFGKGQFNCLSFERGDPFCYIDKNSCSDTKWYKSYWSNEACRGFERGGPDYTVCCGDECYTKGDYRRRDSTGRITGVPGQHYQFNPWSANDRPTNGSFIWQKK